MENKPVKDVWLFNGIPGAGKTTVSRKLAKRFAKGAHVEGDRLHAFVVAGNVAPGGQPKEESNRQLDLCARNMCLLARSFAEAGFVPVMDYVVASRRNLGRYQEQLKGYRLHFVTLAPSLDVVFARDAQRHKHFAKQFAYLDVEMRRELAGVGLLVDSSAMTADQTVEHIVRRKRLAVVP
jgi:gluconate kinase